MAALLQNAGTRFGLAASAAAGALYFALGAPTVEVAANALTDPFNTTKSAPFDAKGDEQAMVCDATAKRAVTLVKQGSEHALRVAQVIADPFSDKSAPAEIFSHEPAVVCEETAKRATKLVKQGSEHALKAAAIIADPFSDKSAPSSEIFAHEPAVVCDATAKRATKLVKQGSEHALKAATILTEPFVIQKQGPSPP